MGRLMLGRRRVAGWSRRLTLATAIVVGMLLPTSPPASAGCTAQPYYKAVYLPLGTKIGSQLTPVSFFISADVVGDEWPHYDRDTYTVWQTPAGGGSMWYMLGYHKVANAGSAFFVVSLCG